MSIELTNGVILPDLPSAVDCIQYPYTIIYHYDAVRSEAPSGYLRYYAIIYSTKPFYVLKGGLLSSGPDVNTLLLNYPGNITYRYATDPLFGSPDVDWQVSNSADEYFAVDIEQDYSYGPSITSLVAANHDVYYVTEYDEATNEVITAQEVYKPRNYYFYKLTAGANIPQKFLGVEGTQQLIDNVKAYVNNAVSNLDLPSGGSAEPDVFIVTLTQEGTGPITASHSSAEICDAIANGKIPFAIFDGGGLMAPVYTYYDAGVSFAFFGAESSDAESYAMSVIYTVGTDKSVVMDVQTAECLPRTGTAGQILAKNEQNVSQWVNADTIKGAKGDTGDQGPQGPAGADGKDGTNGTNGKDGYTPVRGTDYWTEADKAEIKSYVDEAILGGAW